MAIWPSPARRARAIDRLWRAVLRWSAVVGPVVAVVGLTLDFVRDRDTALGVLGALLMLPVAIPAARFLWKRSLNLDATFDTVHVEESDWEDLKVLAEIAALATIATLCFVAWHGVLQTPGTHDGTTTPSGTSATRD